MLETSPQWVYGVCTYYGGYLPCRHTCCIRVAPVREHTWPCQRRQGNSGAARATSRYMGRIQAVSILLRGCRLRSSNCLYLHGFASFVTPGSTPQLSFAWLVSLHGSSLCVCLLVYFGVSVSLFLQRGLTRIFTAGGGACHRGQHSCPLSHEGRRHPRHNICLLDISGVLVAPNVLLTPCYGTTSDRSFRQGVAQGEGVGHDY